ncbi:MAG: Fur family transcriptional regulator [Acutalibacteraceae bacterium]
MQEVSKRNTRQKATIERVVLDACDHPTAETIFARVREELPAVSLGTVYRVLKGLMDEGKVREISVPNAPSRFDKTTRCHAHFVCTECGTVQDVEACENEFLKRTAQNHGELQIEEAEIIFKGLCPVCKEKEL